MKKKIWIVAFILGVLFLGGCENKTQANDKTAALQTRMKNIIIDDANVLFENKKLLKKYADFNEELLRRYDIDFRVITVANDEDIDLFANKSFTTLQQHSRSKSGKALLLVINTKQDKVRMEVSTALEPIYTDAFVSYVERKGMVPYLRDKKISDGVYMMSELVLDRANEATQAKEWIEPMQSRSIGAGAKTKAHIGKQDLDAKKGANVLASSTDDPKAVLQKYINALKAHNKNPNLDIYTDATKAFFRKWTVTDINQDHEVENLSKCVKDQTTLYDFNKQHAVLAVLPYDKHRTCPPIFFKKEDGKWKIDIATMAQSILFNVDMMWHFDMKKRLLKEGKYYAYAFDGVGFDRHGFPYTPKKHHPDWDKYRWQFTCNGYLHPGDTRDDVKCLVRHALVGGKAYSRLGLNSMDKIYGVGEGANKKENVTIDELFDYLAGLKQGDVATLIIEHYYINSKETYEPDAILDPNVEVRYEIRQGIAP